VLALVSEDQYMLGSFLTFRPQEDCFFKME
jgi:hypothetical protein